MSTLPTIMRTHMAGLGLNEAQLAAAVGVDRSTVLRWLDGSTPALEHAMKLCLALRITPTDITDALFPQQMEQLRKVLPNRADLAEQIAASVARADIAERLMQLDDRTLQALLVLIDSKARGE